MVYYLYKEVGITSFQAIRKLQKQYNLKKVGHCGTLDKFAEGLLIVLSGSATKLAGAITGLDKKYCAEIEFGTETSTLDPEGDIVAEGPVPSLPDIERELSAWLQEIGLLDGCLGQVPPAFSAIHSGGKRLYQRALEGEDLSEIPERQVALYACEIISWQAPILQVSLHCSKGFYVRAFARDLARRCYSVGHLRRLRRDAIGSIPLARAKTLSQEPEAGNPADLLLELKELLPLKVWQLGLDLYTSTSTSTSANIPPEDWRLLRQGRIPAEIVRKANEAEAEENLQAYEFAIIDKRDEQTEAQILGLFRFSAEAETKKLKFWHNFCAEREQ